MSRKTIEELQREMHALSKELIDQVEQEMVVSGLHMPVDDREFNPDPERLFEHSFIIATWRRTPYILGAFPQCLVGSLTSEIAVLGGFDCHGSLWRFVQLEHIPGTLSAALECCEIGERAKYLTSSLELSPDPAVAAEWTLELTKPFRGGPLDTPLKIKAPDGKLLCSNEKDCSVALMTQEQADVRDPLGNFVWNIAWECTPEIAVPAEGIQFLDDEREPEDVNNEFDPVASLMEANNVRSSLKPIHLKQTTPFEATESATMASHRGSIISSVSSQIHGIPAVGQSETSSIRSDLNQKRRNQGLTNIPAELKIKQQRKGSVTSVTSSRK